MSRRSERGYHLSCFLMLSIVFAGLGAGHAEAVSIAITNPGFEAQALADGAWIDSTITGWSITGTSSEITAGPWDPTTSHYSAIPEGENVAFSKGPTIAQVLSTSLAPDTVYTLRVDVGHRKDQSTFPSYAVDLRAGSTLLGSASSPVPVADQFLTSTVMYTSPAVGLPTGFLEIRLQVPEGGGGYSQVNFDNVRLDATAVAAVPEPSTVGLLGLAGLVWLGHGWRRRRAS